jgi:tyrosyl-tRNA synthetase
MESQGRLLTGGDNMNDSKERIIREFSRTTEDIFSLEELKTKLDSGRRLKIKFGADVTAPFLHIGHGVNLWMMRRLQEEGHMVQFLIGDFTTRIGDPTGKNQTRKIISREEIKKNAEEFIRQISAVLITDNPEVFEIRRNSEWFERKNCAHLVSLLSEVTYKRLISRDMFRKRIDQEQEIRMHEMIYPVLQGWDSVELKSDITVVGSDQLFNEMMGRFFQEKNGQEPQVVITTKITPGLDGIQKQSKSLNNYVAIIDSPRQKFGKVMSLPDKLIIPWFTVYTTMPEEEVNGQEQDLHRGKNPRDIKLILAEEITARYHGRAKAAEEKEWFQSTFSKKHFPENAPEIAVTKGDYNIVEMLKLIIPDQSKSGLRRLVLQGAVVINGEKQTNPEGIVILRETAQVRVGRKRFFRLAPENSV